MEKVKQFANKYRHRLSMAAILIVWAVVFGWVGLLSLSGAAEKAERVIVNDDYSLTTQEIKAGDGIRQTIQVKGGSRLYGVQANFHIFNRVQFGTVHAEILDSRGNVLARAGDDMTTIKDNTFKGFVFDNCLRPEEDTEYIFHLYIEPATEEDSIALWKSRETYKGFELMENGRRAEGTLALQYINRHVGGVIYKYFRLIAAIALIGTEILHLLLFVKKCRPETAFAVAALTLGTIFAIFTPVGGGPDEYVHIASSYVISNDFMGIENSTGYDKIYVRRCDDVIDLMSAVDYNAFSFRDMYEGLFTGSGGNTELVEVDGRNVNKGALIYLPQALGITLARLLDMGFVQLVVTARMFNLLFFIAVVYLAIRLTPVFKTTLALCSLVPMALQLAGNFSYDTFINAFAFLFITSVFRMAYKDGALTVKDMIIPAVSLCMLTLIKPIYIVMGLLVFTVPNKKFKNTKIALAGKTAVMAVGVVFWVVVNLQSVSDMLGFGWFSWPWEKVRITEDVTPRAENPDVEPVFDAEIIMAPVETAEENLYPFDSVPKEEEYDESLANWDPDSDLLPNGDSKYYFSVSYMLSHLRQTIKLIMNTISHESYKYIRTMIGTRLGEIIVVDLSASPLFLMAFIFVLLLSVVNRRGEQPEYNLFTRRTGLFIFVAVVGLTVAACTMWTPINYEIIFGIQGRYFLPALPLIVLFFTNRFITLEKNIDDILIFSMVPLNLLVLLNVFMIMCK